MIARKNGSLEMDVNNLEKVVKVGLWIIGIGVGVVSLLCWGYFR